MPEFILCSIIILTFATLYAGWKKGYSSLFNKVCNAYLVFVLLHAIFALIIRLSSDNLLAVDISLPFVLGYGPFFLIGCKSLNEVNIKKQELILHFAPFIICLIPYSIIISNSALREEYLMSFYIVQYAYVAISLTGYILWFFLYRRNLAGNAFINESRQLIKTSGYSLIVMVVVFLVILLSNDINAEFIKITLPSIVIYTGVFMSVIFAFTFTINNIVNSTSVVQSLQVVEIESFSTKREQDNIQMNSELETELEIAQSVQQTQKYNKSALSTVALDDYKAKLNNLIAVDKVYLDNELTLEILAKKMRMPMHHLTQLFNVHLGENFNQYINKFRIEHACTLLQDRSVSLSIEQIAFNCGFNSKVSFNRHFKNITGTTPKEYMHTYKKIKKN